MDYKKYDKDGKELNLMPLANRAAQANYYDYWKNSPDKLEPTDEDIKCELQLNALSFWEPLAFNIKVNKFMDEISKFNDSWVPYLRREGVMNDSEGLLLMGLEGDSMNDSLSMPEACRRAGRYLSETEFCYKTDLYDQLPSLHELLDYFQPLGRTMLVKTNKGGFFPPHKDQPSLTRDTFRIIAFPSYHVSSREYEWEMEYTKVPIHPGGVYYVDTRKTHRTHSWMDDSIHLVINVPKTWENVMKLLSITRDY